MSIWAAAEGAILSLGSTWIEEERAYNFSLYARHADGVTLLLFREDDLARPVLEVASIRGDTRPGMSGTAG